MHPSALPSFAEEPYMVKKQTDNETSRYLSEQHTVTYILEGNTWSLSFPDMMSDCENKSDRQQDKQAL